ncbi:MAG: uncharacterized protein A8A55_0717 [Amphiamblys sp. WSBS2006]|nr:MAG: uncharacterized protein A8A55_0717 [Amphiamblys sp. WSBS2006]
MGQNVFNRNPLRDIGLFLGSPRDDPPIRRKRLPHEKREIFVNPHTVQCCDLLLSLARNGFVVSEWTTEKDEGDVLLCPHLTVVFGFSTTEKRYKTAPATQRKLLVVVSEDESISLSSPKTHFTAKKHEIPEMLRRLSSFCKCNRSLL